MSNAMRPPEKIARSHFQSLELRHLIAAILLLLLPLPSFAYEIEGLVYPLYDLSLSANESGEVLSKKVVPGKRVNKGDELLTLDDRLQTIELERRKIIFDDDSELDAEREKSKMLGEMLDQTQKVYDLTGSISKDELTKLKAEYISSQEKYGQLVAQKAREGAEYREAEKEKLLRTVFAPISGIVTKVGAEQGEWVRQGEPVIHLVDADTCVAKIAIPLQYAYKIKADSAIKLTLKTESGNIHTQGRFSFISPVADPASGLVETKIVFDNRKIKIKPGIKASINLD
jgi:RND family efflux transporter MFP subunit